MDPLSITTAVTGLIGVCLKTAVQLDSLRSKYQNAGVIIAALCSESTVISAGLTQMQTLLAQNYQVRNRDDLLTTFDTALTGCLVVFTCLEQETEKLALAGSKGQSKLTWKMRARMIWNDDKMKEYLSLIRGQQTSLSFLIQLLQMQSIDEVYQQVERQAAILEKQATRTESLRRANPSTKIPTSLLSARRSPETLFGDAASTVANTEFAFDDDIVNSKAYRRAMTMARLALSQNSTVTELPEEKSEDPIDIGKPTTSASDLISPALKELRLVSLDPASGTAPAPPEMRDGSNSLETQPKDVLADWEPSPLVMPLEVFPHEVAFRRPFTRIQSTYLMLRNLNIGPIIFKVMTTAPKQYCVRPNFGRIEAGQSLEVLFEMVALTVEQPTDVVTKDKFLIRSMALAKGQKWSTHQLVSDAIRITRTGRGSQSIDDSRDPKILVQEKKVRVVFLPAKVPRPRSM